MYRVIIIRVLAKKQLGFSKNIFMWTQQFFYVPMFIIPMQRRRENNGIVVSHEIH